MLRDLDVNDHLISTITTGLKHSHFKGGASKATNNNYRCWTSPMCFSGFIADILYTNQRNYYNQAEHKEVLPTMYVMVFFETLCRVCQTSLTLVIGSLVFYVLQKIDLE